MVQQALNLEPFMIPGQDMCQSLLNFSNCLGTNIIRSKQVGWQSSHGGGGVDGTEGGAALCWFF